MSCILVAVEIHVSWHCWGATASVRKEVTGVLVIRTVICFGSGSGNAASSADGDAERKEILLACNTTIREKSQALGLIPVELLVVVVVVEGINGAGKMVLLILRWHGHATTDAVVDVDSIGIAAVLEAASSASFAIVPLSLYN